MILAVVEPMGGAMQDLDSFYYRVIRTKLADAPRTQHDPKGPLPETPTKALFQLYEQERDAASETGNLRPRGRA
jgi:hypothetical protein